MKSKWLLLTKIQLMGMLDFNKSRYAKDAKLTRRTAGSFAILTSWYGAQNVIRKENR